MSQKRLMKLSKNGFRLLNFWTIVAVYLLIVVGSIVRVMEAGMGCPDWPKCFGAYVPPGEENLPENYQDYFLEKRLSKNEKLSNVLASLGMSTLAEKVLNDPQIQIEEEYSSQKAWVEYINRLVGVLIGMFIVGYALLSFLYRSDDMVITIVAFLSLLLVLFQGWIGSLVVSTNLLPGFISFHMGLALLLMGMLIYTYSRTSGKEEHLPDGFKVIAIGSFILFLPQILMGTQVREQVDLLLFQGVGRASLINGMTWTFYIHRSFSILLLILSAIGVRSILKQKLETSLFGKLWILSFGLMVFEAGGGAIMAYMDMPKIVQPLHLLTASVLFGLLYYLTLMTTSKRKIVS